MSTREIILDGGSPWGFRMHGGADVAQPLRISRVNPGSKAAQKGVREGDVISSINGQSTRSISNSDAHALLRNAGQTLHLGLNEECTGSPKRRLHRNIQQDSKLESMKRSTVTKTTTAVRTTSVNGATEPNCNNGISGKGDAKSGQNEGVKEGSTVPAPDSKGSRRRRRQQQNTPQRELPGNAKQETDTHVDKRNSRKTSRSNSKDSRSTTPIEGSGSKSRRRRRSRGGSKRKCSVGLDSDVSEVEQKMGLLDTELSTTEPETDATMSDVGGKIEGDNVQGEDLSIEVREVESVNKGSAQEVVGERGFEESDAISEAQVTVEERFASVEVRKESVETETQKKIQSRVIKKDEAQEECDESVQKEEGIDIKSIVSKNDCQEACQIDLKTKRIVDYDETMKEFTNEIRLEKDEILENEREEKINELTDEFAKETINPQSITDCENVVLELDVPLLVDDDIKEIEDWSNKETGNLSDVREIVQDFENRHENVCGDAKVVISDDCSEVETLVGLTGSSISCSGDDTSRMRETQFTDKHKEDAASNPSEHTVITQEITSLDNDAMDVKQEIKQISVDEKCDVSNCSIKKTDETHEKAEFDRNAENCEFVTEEKRSSETVSLETSCKKNECTIAVLIENKRRGLEEKQTTLETGCQEGFDSTQAFVSNNSTSENDLESKVEGNRSEISTEVKIVFDKRETEICTESGSCPLECRAVIVETCEDDWEEADELCEDGVDNCREENAIDGDVEGCDGGCLLSTNTTALVQDMKLSKEDKELLDPCPIAMEDEENLRQFLHSLNLTDYSKEAVNARNAMLKDGVGIEEIYASRRGKRRTSLETVSTTFNQQRGLDVILEENSSDYSDGEKRIEEAGTVERRTGAQTRGHAWEEAIYIPETNQVVYLNDSDDTKEDSEDTRVRNQALYYSEVITDGVESGEKVCHVYQRVGKARCVAEEVSVDVFSEDMENTLENMGHSEECDSEGSRRQRVWSDKSSGGEEGKVELADSTDDEDDVKGTWKIGRARERQDIVELVYLEEDSGSTSSGSCVILRRADEAAEDADGEDEDPDVLYEGIEFPVIGVSKITEDVSINEIQSSNVVYENVEFHKNGTITFPTKKTKEINDKIDVILRDENSSAIYENVEFVRQELSEDVDRESSSTPIVYIEDDSIRPPEISEEIPEFDTPKDKCSDGYNEKKEPDDVTRDVEQQVSPIRDLVPDKRTFASETAVTKETSVYSKTVDFVKRILSMMPQKENIDNKHLESIITQLSGETQTGIKEEEIAEILSIEDIENDAKREPEERSEFQLNSKSSDTSKLVQNNSKPVQLNLDTNSLHVSEPSINPVSEIYFTKLNVIGIRDEDDCLEDMDSITPTNRSRHESSSSDAGSHGTTVFCPGRISPQSSDADISSYTEETTNVIKPARKIYSPLNFRHRLSKSRSHENISESKKIIPQIKNNHIKYQNPKTLKDISIDRVISLPCGCDILKVLGINIPSRDLGKDDNNLRSSIQEAVKRFQLYNIPCKSMGKPPLTGSLPDLSSMKQETYTKDQLSSNTVQSFATQPVVSLAGSNWLGMPTKEDPNLFVCLSPSQRKSYEEEPTPEEADNLLDLHQKFLQRRSYHENPPPPPPNRKFFGIRHLFSNSSKDRQMSPGDEARQEISRAAKLVPSPRFRAVLTSLDSKIHSKGNTRELEDRSEDVQVGRSGDEAGGVGKEGGCSKSRSSSRLLAILRAAAGSSEPQEFRSPSSSSSAASSPPPLPPLPHAYQHRLAMLGFLQHQGKRHSTICCNEYDFTMPQTSPSCYSSDDTSLCDDKSPSSQTGSHRKERTSSWYGQSNDRTNKDRLKVRSLSDWLHLVRCGGSNRETDGTRSKDSTPPVSACMSTQSSPGPIRRREPSPKPESQLNCIRDHQKLKQEILEKRFSETRLEQAYQPDKEPIKPPLLPTSARDDERHDQQLKVLHQRQQQRLRNQQLIYRREQQEKRPPLPQKQESDVQSQDNHGPLGQQEKQQSISWQEKRLPLPQKQESDLQSQDNHGPLGQQEKQQSWQEKRLPLPQKQESDLQSQDNHGPLGQQEKQQSWQEKQVEHRFDAENYRISKKGDIAIINNNATMQRVSRYDDREGNSRQIYQQYRASLRPKSMPPPTESLVTGGEIFRQQMYLEYMNKVAERAQRRRQKVIRLSGSVPRDGAPASARLSEATDSSAQQLESEFMGRVRDRMDKLGLASEEHSDDEGNRTDSNCYVVAGGAGGGGNSGGDAISRLPKHLQEFLVITGSAGTDSDVTSDVDGVWSPSQKPSSGTTEESNFKDQEERKNKEGDDAPPAVWTPKSAGASPTTERKEFRPVSFESPTLPRKHRSANSTPAPLKLTDDFEVTSAATQDSSASTTTTFSSIFQPWQHSRDDSALSVGSTVQSPTSEKSVASSTLASTLDRRLVQSQSAPASGLSALAAGGSTSIKLPRAQNPTITLLQKAREGQLPRGALYLDHKMNSKEGEKSYVSPNEILYSVKKEYESEGEEFRKKMVELGPRKFEGIGPTTKEGIPIVLRSEVKDANQAKWYKRMYESLHRAGKDDEYITIRYKPRRGHYPYTSPGGYLSEPEPALYDSDIGYSAKYATLDRRRIKNKENDFTTSTLPRSRYVPHPSSIKYVTDVYKNQPGRIEDYEPGHSSISDKETKQWWDEVLDIFDGWLETHSPHHQHHPNYRSSSFLTADAIYQRQARAEPQTTPSTPSNKPFMTYALKESGYESDSTLVFKRRDENLQSQLSPAEQKIAYKTIQKGGEVPLHGLRKPAPERPKDISEIEYFPISPHLTRIRVHKQNITPLREIVCYPVTATYTNAVPPVFSTYKRTAPSFIQVTPRKPPAQPPPPSPPRRQSSHHSSTLRLWSKMRLPSHPHTSPLRSRHESCFSKDTNVKFLRDRLTHKLSGKSDRPVRMSRTASSSPVGTRTRPLLPSPTPGYRSRSAPEESVKRKTETSSSDLRSRRAQQEAARTLSRSPDLTSPLEVRKILQKQREKDVRERLGSRALPPGTVVRSSTTMYSSARHAGRHCHPEDKSLRVTVAMSARGRELLQPKTATSTVTSTLSAAVHKPAPCSKSPTPSPSPTLGSQKGSVSSRQTVRSGSPCHISPSSSTSKTKPAVSPCPSLSSSPLKRTSRSASRECMRTDSPRESRTSRTTTSSLMELATDEGNRRIRRNSTTDVKKRAKEKLAISSVKAPLAVPKTTGRTTTSPSSGKGPEKEDKEGNKKKSRKNNGEPKRAQVSKKNGQPAKSTTGGKPKVNGEEKKKSRKPHSMPRIETMSDLTTMPASEDLAAQIDVSPQQNIGPGNTESFFQHLLLRDIPSPTPSTASSLCRSSSVLEKARRFHEQITGSAYNKAPYRTESTLGLLNVYLAQKRPVSESKFRSLDREMSLSSRSPSPSYRSVTLPVHTHLSRLKADGSSHDAEVGMFYSLGPSRSRTPESEGKARSSSEPPLLSPATRTRLSRGDQETQSTSPTRCQSPASSMSPTRSAACRRIKGTRSQTLKTVESIAGPKRKGIRARSAGDADDTKQGRQRELSPLLQTQSTSSLNLPQIADHADYQSYVMELMHSTKKSDRFRELHKFYSSLERLGQLERTTSTGDLRPRLKGEEVIDYDRWRQLRTKEKAEEEMKVLYRKLKEDQRQKDLLFQPKDAESLRWKGERDRGLRCKEKSVENLKYHFGKLSVEETDLEAARRKELAARKDVYKPLWRGSSVLNLANCLSSVTCSKRGRPVVADRADLRFQSSSRSLSRHPSGRYGRGIGSRLWSSLSMDQVNALKTQLSEIYSSVSNLRREGLLTREDYEITVPPESGTRSSKDEDSLHVRCNSLLTRDQLYSPLVRRREARRTESMKADSISSLPHWKRNGSKPKHEATRSQCDRAKPLSETEKKRLSMTLSQEVLDRVTRKHKSYVPVVRGRETRGAIAAAAAKGKVKTPSPSSSPVLSDTVSPRTCYSLEMSEEDASRKNDFLLVLTPSDGSQSRNNEVQKVVEEWANAKPSTSKTESDRKATNGVLARLVRTTSASETESASSDASTRTVIHRSKDEVLHKVEYFERKQEGTRTDGRVCRSTSDVRPPRHPVLTHSSRAKSAPGAFSTSVSLPKSTAPPKLRPSQSYADLKELFGEQSRLRYATVPLMTRKRQESTSPTRSVPGDKGSELDNRSRQDSPYRAYCSSSSTESLFHQRSRSVSPDPTKYWRAYLRMVKRGDVRRLRDKFESLEDLYYISAREGDGRRSQSQLKRYRSDPEIARDFLARRGTDPSRVVVRGHEVGDVRWLRRRYEACCRGRSRGRKTRALSPVQKIPFRAEDRYMPHINVISKTAALQHRATTASPAVLEDDGFTHFHTGEVQRIREKFESQLSLLGQMFTSTPDVRELRDIAPYLGCHWVAHRYPDTQPNSRSLSSPELRPAPPIPGQSRPSSRPRPASSSPTRSRRQPLSILKPQQTLQQRQTPVDCSAAVVPGRDVFANQAFDPTIHRPLYRYQPLDNTCLRYRTWNAGSNLWWRHCPTNPPRPTVTFKEPAYGPVPPRGYSPRERVPPESPHRYVESEVTIHYRSPVRSEAKEVLSEEELARRQAEAMRRIYQEERRRKYLQELQDMHSRRHTDNFTPSQKSPIPLNRYDDFLEDVGNKGKPRDRTPEPKLVARALYNFVGQTSRELSFRRGDIIFVRRQIDKNWYEGEHNAMVGLFPFNYVEIIPYDGIRTIPKRPSEGQARAKFNFIAQTHLELSLVKGELVVLTRRVDDNWFEGRIGSRKGIFPVSYVEVLSEPGEKPVTPLTPSSKPITLPASHTVLMNGSGIKQSMGQHSYQPSSYYSQNKITSSYTSSNPYATLPRQSQSSKHPLAPVNQTLHIDTHSEPVPYRALYNYRPQNEDELELCEGDTVYVMEKCDDGWYVGSSQRTGCFGTFPGNYVERI